MSLEAAEETLAEFVPGYPDPVQLLPPGWRDAGGPTADGGTILRIPEKETIDVVPPGEVEEHRGDHVHATDGEAGHLRALRIDPGSRRVTHVLVRDGHVWGRADIDIPAEMVAGFGERHPAQRHPAAGTGPAAGRPRPGVTRRPRGQRRCGSAGAGSGQVPRGCGGRHPGVIG